MPRTSGPEDLTHLVRGLPIFHDVSDTMLDLLTPDMVKFYRHGDVVFTQDDDAEDMMVLLRGQVCISANGTFLVARQPYEILGEQALIENTRRTATGIAQGAVKALVIPRAIAERLINDPPFLRNLARALSQKLSQATSERAIRYRTEEMLFSEFRAHVSEPVLNRLLATGLNYGEPRFIDGVVLLSDIRSFTDLSADLEPAQIAAQLSPYLDAMVEIIHQHEGMVDKFIGDAVMALWGFSPTENEMAAQALNCAQEMVEAAARMTFGGHPIRIGVGLNAGQIFLGNVGGEGKRQFTVLGSPVNLTARFESASKCLGAPIVTGTAFYERLTPEEQMRLHPHPDQPIKGAPNQTLYTYDVTVAEGE